MMIWWRRLFRQRALERELDAELRDHVEREVAEGVRAGDSEADVRRQIRLTSGGLDQIKEECRDVRRPSALADVAADVRFAWCILARNGWATAGAILTLALAMGVANTTFISTYAVLWRDFPFERPDRIARQAAGPRAHGHQVDLRHVADARLRREGAQQLLRRHRFHDQQLLAEPQAGVLLFCQGRAQCVGRDRSLRQQHRAEPHGPA